MIAILNDRAYITKLLLSRDDININIKSKKITLQFYVDVKILILYIHLMYVRSRYWCKEKILM